MITYHERPHYAWLERDGRTVLSVLRPSRLTRWAMWGLVMTMRRAR